MGVFLFGGPLAALFVLPIFAWFASRSLVHGGSDLWAWARHGHKKGWNGRYYEFATLHLRAQEVDGELVFVESDLLEVIEQPQSKTVELFGPGERIALPQSDEPALTQAGCERLLLKCPHPEAKKLLLFLRREAFFPHARRHARGHETPPPG